jgi:hypothetical protein
LIHVNPNWLSARRLGRWADDLSAAFLRELRVID